MDSAYFGTIGNQQCICEANTLGPTQIMAVRTLAQLGPAALRPTVAAVGAEGCGEGLKVPISQGTVGRIDDAPAVSKV